MTEWISCNDQQPTDEVDLLLYSKKEGILKGIYHISVEGESLFFTECFKSHRPFKPTHWMKIPEAPI